jgi:hypothetical protein
MSQSGLGLGRLFDIVPVASGKHLSFKNCEAITFITYEDDGSTILTLRESKSGADEQLLAVIDLVHKKPGVGGAAWTPVPQAAASAFDLADDTTNDATVTTVRARELTNGFDCVEASVDGGFCVAILHDLNHMGDPATMLVDPVVA